MVTRPATFSINFIYTFYSEFKRWHELSGDEAQRIALASRLVLRSKVLILDEPTARASL
ncbi:MAG: ATP-binding cassette domain-containing protein [Deltaproteobacteria bacterium]|nr:ATP-binding cassette domain-containing protein [Deltaproteobacteria bacterium]